MAEESDALEKKKSHRDRHSGRKAEKKKAKNQHVQELTAKQKNPKAFTFNSAVRAERRFRRKQDVETKRQHIPLIDRTPLEPPPVVVAIVGPPKVGKTTLIQCLIRSFTKQPMTSLKGPVTLVSGKKRRITLMECNNDINSMIDIAKVADLVLLLVDASFGFEMEIFEFLNICQVHGMPRVMGVLTHLDMLKNNKQLKKTKKTLKHRFWAEVYAGAKLFYLSGILHGEYMRNEVKNLGRFISVMKFRPLTWRTTHPYILADRLEDLTPPELVRQNPKTDRLISLYGYVRGIPLNKTSSIHIPGCGDLKIHDVSHLPDPCPLPDKLKKRTLVEKERLVYAPFSGVGGIVYDKDAVYVELGGSHSHGRRQDEDSRPEKALVSNLLDTQETLDVKMARSELQLFSGTAPITSADVTEKTLGITQLLVNDSGRLRRKAVFPDNIEDEIQRESTDESDDDENEDEDIDDNEDNFIVASKSKKKYKVRTEEDSDSSSEEEADDETLHDGNMKKNTPTKSTSGSVNFNDEERVEAESDSETMSEDELNNDQLSKRESKREDDQNESTSGDFQNRSILNSQTPTEYPVEKLTKMESESLNKTKKRKKKDNALAAAESKLLAIIAEDSDAFENEEENMEDEVDETEDEVPVKKRKLSEDNDLEMKKSDRHEYRGIGSEQDKAIHSKVSSLLTQLQTRKKEQQKVASANTSKEEKIEFEMQQFSSDEDSSGDEVEEKILAKQEKDNDSSNSTTEHDETEGEDFSEEKEEKEEGDQEDSAVRWKSNLAQKAADAFLERQATTQNLWKLVYGNLKQKVEAEEKEGGSNSEGEEAVGGLFRVVNRKQQHQQEEKDLMNVEDCSKFEVKQVRDWLESDVREVIRDCFVTGKWKESEDAAELLRLDDASDEELFGDFEDLETGEKHESETKTDEMVKDGAEGGETKKLTREEIQEKKRKLKEKFDAEYDDKDGGKTYYDELKQEVDQQAQLNKNEFEGLDDAIRIELEGYRPGMYVRVEVGNVPCELITNFDPTYPLILGGLLAGEENIGYVQVRIKKHRWHKKILKTRDPLIMSLGWRRFQTLPIYSKLEDNLRHRMLKYTPEHVTCMAHFWGPITPQSTGFLAVQDVASRQANFRIAATGSVVELDKSTQIMKKLKLTGTPYKVYKKTAFIRDMFNTMLEVAKFEGARLKTVSGIRGQIKKAVSKPEGSFRATFEDKILLSDIVFCRTWYRVEVPKLYNPVTSLLLPVEQKNMWRGMKTVGQLKREKGIRSEPAKDSLYTSIERQPKVFRPLVIPRTLQKELPYKDKPKNAPKMDKKKAIESGRIAVVREPHEQKVASLMKMLKVSYNYKQEKMKQEVKQKIKEHLKEKEKEEWKKLKRQKELKKQVFRTLSKLEAKNKNSFKKR